MEKVHRLADDDLPTLFHEADRCSIRLQRSYLRWSRFQAICLIIGAGAGAATWVPSGKHFDVLGAVALLAFLAAGWATLIIRDRKLERGWYETRALAESVKTLAWKYAVGGDPFPISDKPHQSEEEYLRMLGSLSKGFENLPIAVAPGTGSPVTTGMRELRDKDLADRRHAYLTDRVGNQQKWYSSKARWNERRSNFWSVVIAILVGVAVIAALLKVMLVVDIDYFGVLATASAGAAGWVKLKQHDTLVGSYSVAARELSIVSGSAPSDEPQWGGFVSEAEEAISREHTMWLASRGQGVQNP